VTDDINKRQQTFRSLTHLAERTEAQSPERSTNDGGLKEVINEGQANNSTVWSSIHSEQHWLALTVGRSRSVHRGCRRLCRPGDR
jgi:hypothetical protein